MRNLNKREKIFVAIIVVLVVGFVYAFSALNTTQVKCNELACQNYSLQEENNDVESAKSNLLEALKREHRIALSTDTKLLVANLAWLDRVNDTFYMDAFIDLDSGEGNCFKRLKKLFDEDEDARARAVNIVCYHLDNLCLYDITDDYYDQIANESQANG